MTNDIVKECQRDGYKSFRHSTHFISIETQTFHYYQLNHFFKALPELMSLTIKTLVT